MYVEHNKTSNTKKYTNNYKNIHLKCDDIPITCPCLVANKLNEFLISVGKPQSKTQGYTAPTVLNPTVNSIFLKPITEKE